MSLIYGYSKAKEDCASGETSKVVFKEVVGSFVVTLGGGNVEVTSGWNDVPNDSTILFVLIKSKSSMWISLNDGRNTIMRDVRLSDKWKGKVAIFNRHDGKLFARISGSATETVDIKFVYINNTV